MHRKVHYNTPLARIKDASGDENNKTKSNAKRREMLTCNSYSDESLYAGENIIYCIYFFMPYIVLSSRVVSALLRIITSIWGSGKQRTSFFIATSRNTQLLFQACMRDFAKFTAKLSITMTSVASLCTQHYSTSFIVNKSHQSMPHITMILQYITSCR